MLNKKNNIILIIIFFIILLSIISALIIEHVLGHRPCSLCFYERIPYFLSVILIIKIIFLKRYEKITLFILFLVFTFSSLLAFYHFGIEQGFLNEAIAWATNNLTETLSKEQLLEELKQNSISCKNVSFRIFGLSLAAFNAIFSVILSAIFIKLFNNYGKN